MNIDNMKIGVSYSTVSETELLAGVVTQYKVDRPLSCQFWQRGINDTYRVISEEDIFSLRVYRHELRAKSEIEFELAAINHLSERGVSVAHPIEKLSGGFISEINAPEGLRYVIMTTHAAGVEPDYDDADNGYLFGSSVADLHNHSSGFKTRYARPRLDITHLLDQPLGIITPFLENRPEDLEFVGSTAADLRRAVSCAPLEKLDIGFCHGDCHGCNVHFSDNVLTHFDFDCCGFGFRAFELATFRWGIRGDDNEDDLWSRFLEGYRSKRDINDDDLALVGSFVVIRHIWWMALIMGNAADFGRRATSDEFVDHQIGRIRRLLE